MRPQIARILRHKFTSCNASNSRCLTISRNVNTASTVVRVKENSTDIYIQESTLPAVDLVNADIFSYALRYIQNYTKFTAIECGITGRNYNYGQMLDGALRFSTYIQKLLPGVNNPTVSFLTPNSPEYMLMFFGCMAMGAVVSPINPMYTPAEIASHIKDSNALILVVDEMVEPLADSALKLLGKCIPVIVNGESSHGRPNVQEILVDASIQMSEPLQVDPSTIAFLPFSSGTTGKPKGVQLSHAAITNNMVMYLNEQISIIKHAEGHFQERYLGILPFFHIFGTMAGLLQNVVYGGKLVTMPMFEPNFFIALLKKYKMTCLTVVPPLLNFISTNPQITKEDLSELRTFVVGGAPVPQPAALAMREKAQQATFQEGYGLTETLLTHVTPITNPKLGYCGRLLSNSQAKIVDLESGETLPANSKGELCVKVPSVMNGYLNNQEATKEIIDDNGWLHTGDVAIYTEDGYYSIVDRIKELIKVKGLQVSPSEVEETLVSHPGIHDAGVIGVPNSRLGEAPLAFIVKSDPSLTENEVHQHMARHLAQHKHLEGGIKFVDELPKSQTGKLLRRVLKEMMEPNN